MTIKSIKGTLAPANGQAITKQTASKINKAANASGLSGVIKPSPAWHFGIIVTSGHPEEDLTGFQFMSRLRELIHAEGVAELTLAGTLTVRVDTKPSEFKVVVETGNISCEEVKFSHLMNPEKSALNPILRMGAGHPTPLTVLVTEGFVK